MSKNLCPQTPYSPKNPYESKGKTTDPIQTPYSEIKTPYTTILPQTSPIQNPYSRKNPYNQKASKYSAKVSPFSEMVSKFSEIVNPYVDKYFCPLPIGEKFLLIDSLNFLVIDSAGNKLNINV
jgi:hypothetical protein